MYDSITFLNNYNIKQLTDRNNTTYFLVVDNGSKEGNVYFLFNTTEGFDIINEIYDSVPNKEYNKVKGATIPLKIEYSESSRDGQINRRILKVEKHNE